MYVQKKTPSEGISPKKLAGFEKVFLLPGEEKEIAIRLDEKAFMHYDVNSHDWERDGGVYEVTVGGSIQDIRLTEQVEIRKAGQITPDSSIGDMLRIPGMYEKLERAFAGHPVSLGFLEMTKDEDPLRAVSMGSLMTFNTLKRVDSTLMDCDIERMIREINKN